MCHAPDSVRFHAGTKLSPPAGHSARGGMGDLRVTFLGCCSEASAGMPVGRAGLRGRAECGH